jgi:GntR family transcriptional regulator/MocR family aminotransferase
MRRIAMIGLAVLVTSGTVGAAEQKLDGAGIKTTLAGARLYFNNGDILIDYKADGTMSGSASRGGSDAGKWWIDGDKFCRQWVRWASAKKGCAVMYQDGSKIRFEDPDTKKSVSGNLSR